MGCFFFVISWVFFLVGKLVNLYSFSVVFFGVFFGGIYFRVGVVVGGIGFEVVLLSVWGGSVQLGPSSNFTVVCTQVLWKTG